MSGLIDVFFHWISSEFVIAFTAQTFAGSDILSRGNLARAKNFK
jgi:hypothetical protein